MIFGQYFVCSVVLTFVDLCLCLTFQTRVLKPKTLLLLGILEFLIFSSYFEKSTLFVLCIRQKLEQIGLLCLCSYLLGFMNHFTYSFCLSNFH